MEYPGIGNAQIDKHSKRNKRRIMGGATMLVFGAASIFGLANATRDDDNAAEAITARNTARVERVTPEHTQTEVKLSPEAIKFIMAAQLMEIQRYIWETRAFMLDTALHGGLTRLAWLETKNNWDDCQGKFTGGTGTLEEAYDNNRDPDMPAQQCEASPAVQKIVAWKIGEFMPPYGDFGGHKYSTAAAAGLPTSPSR